MKCFLILATLLISVSTKPRPLRKIKVRSDGHYVDDSGRVRIFHGFNAVNKGFPWYPEQMSNETIVKTYKEWGFNAVRLGTMWSGAEPKQGQFNETYLAALTSQIKLLADHGLYVILDMHQDVLSERFGTYDGAPSWLVDLLPLATHPYPYPWNSTKPFAAGNWFKQYFTQGCCTSFQGLYDNANGSQDLLARFWRKIAETFKSLPSVLGYELINEPWAGDIYKDPALLLEPGHAGRKNLAPMYEKLAKSIRKADNDTIIMYEPVTWGVWFNGKVFGTGLDAVPGGPDYRDRSALSYHLYCFLTSGSADPLKPYQQVFCDDLYAPDVMLNAHREIKRTGGAGFLTEFGECEPDGRKNSSNTVLCETVLGLADKYMASWTYWDSDFYWDNGTCRWDLVEAFVRPYPRAIAGTPISMHFEPDRLVLFLEYEMDPSIKEPTEIFVPPLHYPNGIKVNAPGQPIRLEFDEINHILLIHPKSSVVEPLIVKLAVIPNF